MSRIVALARGLFSEPRPPSELRSPSPRWSHARPAHPRRTLRVAEVVRETPSTCTFVLEPADDRLRPLAYRPGQHLTLLVSIGGDTHRRCYSFSSSPASGARPAITVRRTPDGLVSRHLHDHVRAGHTIVALEATGDFTIDIDPQASRALALVAGGVGITPLVSLAETVLREEPGSRVVLLCGHRSEEEIIFRRRLADLETQACGRLRLLVALDAPPPGWTGLAGALDGPRVLAVLGEERADAYFVCGPEPMMRSVCAALAAAGVPRERVRTERFAYASAGATRLPDHGARITFAASGRQVGAPAGQTILQAGIEAGIDLPSSCTMGGCGACKLRKASGTVVMSEPNCLSEVEREAGYILACCSYAETDVVIENH